MEFTLTFNNGDNILCNICKLNNQWVLIVIDFIVSPHFNYT